MGSNLSGATSSELCSKVAKIFLLIEDEDFSESRTKIGLSVDKFTTTKLLKYCSYSIDVIYYECKSVAAIVDDIYY